MMGLVVNFFKYFLYCAAAAAIFDLVHNVKAIFHLP